MPNRTIINGPEVLDYYVDRFPLPSEDDDFNLDGSNQTFYDDFIVNETRIWNETNLDVPSFSSIFSFSSPFSYIILILFVYLILTLILLSFSLYKQRQNDVEHFCYGETEEELQQAKRTLAWKQFLIGKISKGDMEPLLSNKDSSIQDQIENESNTATFPLHIV